MRCEECGKELRRNAVFCLQCGQRVPRAAHAGIMPEIATAEGLADVRDVLEAPEAAEAAEIPDGVPAIPTSATIPGARAGTIPTGETATGGLLSATSISRARLREVKRRKTQDDAETLQIDLAKRFAESATAESVIEGAGVYDIGDVHPTIEEEVRERRPPPPPPPPTREAPRDEDLRERVRQLRAEREPDDHESVPVSSCFTAGCVTLAVLVGLLMLMTYLMELDEPEAEPEADTAAIEYMYGQLEYEAEHRGSATETGFRSFVDTRLAAGSVSCPDHILPDRVDGRPTGDVLHRVRIRHPGWSEVLS